MRRVQPHRRGRRGRTAPRLHRPAHAAVPRAPAPRISAALSARRHSPRRAHAGARLGDARQGPAFRGVHAPGFRAAGLRVAHDSAAQGTLRRGGARRRIRSPSARRFRGDCWRANRSSSSRGAKAWAARRRSSAACRQAGFAPRLAYTPSLIGTVLSYVEAGAGIGIVPESVITPELPAALHSSPAGRHRPARARLAGGGRHACRAALPRTGHRMAADGRLWKS